MSIKSRLQKLELGNFLKGGNLITEIQRVIISPDGLVIKKRLRSIGGAAEDRYFDASDNEVSRDGYDRLIGG